MHGVRLAKQSAIWPTQGLGRRAGCWLFSEVVFKHTFKTAEHTFRCSQHSFLWEERERGRERREGKREEGKEGLCGRTNRILHPRVLQASTARFPWCTARRQAATAATPTTVQKHPRLGVQSAWLTATVAQRQYAQRVAQVSAHMHTSVSALAMAARLFS